MTNKEIYKIIREKAQQTMTEVGIHPDEWSDNEHLYIDIILRDLSIMNT